MGTVSISSNAVCQPIKELNNDKEKIIDEELKEDSTSTTALGNIDIHLRVCRNPLTFFQFVDDIQIDSNLDWHYSIRLETKSCRISYRKLTVKCDAT